MKKLFFQILYKGVVSNRIFLKSYDDYSIFSATLEAIKESKYLMLLTTNIFYDK